MILTVARAVDMCKKTLSEKGREVRIRQGEARTADLVNRGGGVMGGGGDAPACDLLS